MSAAFIYIAYAPDDGAEVAIVADHLRERGWSVCFGRLTEPSLDGSEVNAERLEAATSVVAVWSSNAANSSLVRSDLLEAARRNKLVVVALDDAAPPAPGAVVLRTDGAPSPQSLEALDERLGMPFGRSGRRRGRTIAYGPAPDARKLWFSVGAALGAGALAGAVVTALASGHPGGQPQDPPVAAQVSPMEVRAPGDVVDGAMRLSANPPRDQGQIRGYLDARGGDARGGDAQGGGAKGGGAKGGAPGKDGAQGFAQRFEEVAWAGVFDTNDLPARLAAISVFRIDFPSGVHAREAVELEASTRTLMEQIRTNLILLGFMPGKSGHDTETLRSAVKAFERSRGVSSSGRITEILAQGLRNAVENIPSLR